MPMFGNSRMKVDPLAARANTGLMPMVDDRQTVSIAPNDGFAPQATQMLPSFGISPLSSNSEAWPARPTAMQGPYNTPPFAPGNLTGATPNDGNAPTGSPTPTVDLNALSAPIDMSHVKVKRGFNDPGGTGDILRSIAATMMSFDNPAGANAIWSSMTQRRGAAAQQQRLEAQRLADRQEWMWREQWKLQHPDDQFTQYITAARIDPASPQGQALYRQRAESMAAPPLMAVDGFDGQGNQTKTFYPRTAFGGGMDGQSASGPAAGTVRNGYRFKGGNPNDRNSWVPVGGASSNGGATFPAVMDAVVSQESSGRAGVVGPATAYGRAQGAAQLLPATAKAMAAKIGVPWRPDLMTAKTPAAANYQRALGEAYLQEGIAATGNLRDGLRYYHGGPSRKLWGPKTNAYADAVLARMGA